MDLTGNAVLDNLITAVENDKMDPAHGILIQLLIREINLKDQQINRLTKCTIAM